MCAKNSNSSNEAYIPSSNVHLKKHSGQLNKVFKLVDVQNLNVRTMVHTQLTQMGFHLTGTNKEILFSISLAHLIGSSQEIPIVDSQPCKPL